MLSAEHTYAYGSLIIQASPPGETKDDGESQAAPADGARLKLSYQRYADGRLFERDACNADVLALNPLLAFDPQLINDLVSVEPKLKDLGPEPPSVTGRSQSAAGKGISRGHHCVGR